MSDPQKIELLTHNTNSKEKTAEMLDAQNGRILIIDDDIETLDVLHSILEEKGFTITSTQSATKALEYLLEHTFDLIITDLTMPEMNGIELLQAALQKDPDLVGIIMTGHDSAETAVDVMKAGAFDYLTKPFRSQMLLPICSRAIRFRQLSRSERRYRTRVDELTLMMKKLNHAAKQSKIRETEIEELKEEIESLKAELANYHTADNQRMFYEV